MGQKQVLATGRSISWSDSLTCAGACTMEDLKAEGSQLVLAMMPVCRDHDSGGGSPSSYDISIAERSLLNSILINASARGKVAPLSAALDAGADIEARTAGVCVGKDAEEVEIAPDFGVGDIEEEPCARGLTPLMRAAKGGHAEAASLLLSRRASPLARDELGCSALHYAAATGSFDTCMALLRAGARRWTLDLEGRDAFAHLPSHLFEDTRKKSLRRFEQVLRPGGEWSADLRRSRQQRGAGYQLTDDEVVDLMEVASEDGDEERRWFTTGPGGL